jgi:oligosaccharide repeat unit polymerase
MTGKAARQKPPGWILFFLFAGSLLILLREELERNLQLAAIAACSVAIASVWALSRAHPRRWISLGSAYAALFALFHMSLLFPLMINKPIQPLDPLDTSWIETPGFKSAVVLVAIAQAVFSLGYLVNSRVKGRNASPQLPIDVSSDEGFATDGPGVVGPVLLTLGILLWMYSVISTGAAVIGASKLDFLEHTKNTNIADAYLLMGFGMAVAASSHSITWRHRALLCFGVWAVPAFVLGLRGEVIIPFAAYLIVAARRRTIRLRPWVFAAAIGALAAGSAVRVLRQFGAGATAFDISSFNPFDGLAELGGSIQPLVVVVNYHQSGEPFIGLDTYLAPFRRVFIGRILGGETLPTAEDPSVFSTMIVQRVGFIGGSPAAEAYRSGGVVALVIVMLLIGFVVASLDSLPNKKLTNSLVGMLSTILLIWVRNDFTPVFTETFEALFVLIPIWFLEQWSNARPKGLHTLDRVA